MEQKEPDKPINDDILKCRENILRAGGSDPGANKPVSQKIPSFEEIISKQTGPKEADTPAEPPVVEDESEGSGMEILADTDWHLPGETVELVDDTAGDAELENILEKPDADEYPDVLMSDEEMNPSSPLVSKAEQEELLAEFDDIDEYDPMDEDEEVEETELVKEIEEGLAAMSETDEDQSKGIPEFNVYDRILSDERKESSKQRQGPGGNGRPKNSVPAASGTVGDIINSSKGIAKNEKSEASPQEKVNSEDTVRGIIHGHDNMNDIQVEIISDIVARHIASFYGKTG